MTGDTIAPAIDEARFRHVLGYIPTGVTAITASPVGGPVGLTVGSFFSVSLDPPLVGFCADKASSSYPRLAEVGRFCVNVLAEGQQDVCRAMARRGGDKFAGLGWRPTPRTGSPLLDGVLAWLDCTIDAVHEAGDHWIVVARVLDLDLDAGCRGGPLVFCQGGLGRYVA